MNKTIIAAAVAAATISGASALDDRFNVDLNYTDKGESYTSLLDGDTNQLDSNGVTLGLDTRYSSVELSATIDEDGDVNASAGLVGSIGGNFAVVAGVTEYDSSSAKDDDVYYGAIYETDTFEARYVYEDDSELQNVSGRYYVADNWALNAGVEFESIDDLGEDSTYTAGVSYRF